MRAALLRCGLAALAALSLSGCIDSADPILADSKPLFGDRLKLQLYTLRDGYAHEPEQASFVWANGRYMRRSGTLEDITAFSVHDFEQDDYIIQTVPKRGHHAEYALAHKLAEGVFQVVAIDEADADEATRAANCKERDKFGCRIETRPQLMAFARATQAQRKAGVGGLAIRLPDAAEKPARRRQK